MLGEPVVVIAADRVTLCDAEGLGVITKGK